LRNVTVGALALLLSVGLAATGCSASYNGERLFWKAQQLSEPISKNPDAATPEQYREAVEAFETVVKQAPGTLWAARAQLAVGSLYSLQKQFAKARAAYALVVQNYNSQKDLVVNARLATAKTYQAEDNWDEAVRVYNEIVEYHPWAKLGLEAPLYVAAVYRKQGKAEEATKAFQQAERLYTKRILNAPTPELANRVKGYLTIVYTQLEQWQDAVTILEEMAAVETGVNRPLVLLSIGTLYQSKLNEPEKAQEAYHRLLAEFPDHPFGKTAKAQLERLGAPEPVPGTPATAGETAVTVPAPFAIPAIPTASP
jgi:tetratricopeptide (TPR) repeat protein